MKNVLSSLSPQTRQALNLIGVNGIYWFAWAVGSYQTVYLQSIGFSASQLGVVNAASSGVAIASISFWGMVSDKIGSLRRVLIILYLCSAALFSLVPLIPTGFSFSAILFTVLLPSIHFFRGSTPTFTENLLVRNCNESRLNYGVIRGMGSFLFTVGGVVISFLLPLVTVKNTFWVSGLLMLPAALCVVFAREPNARVKKGNKGEKLDTSELFRNRAYVTFLVFALLFYLAASCESTFIPYLMKDIGVSSDQHVIILSYRALLEIPFLLLMVKLRRRFPLRILVIAAGALMAIEAIGYSLFANSLVSMLFFATFYGLGNGLFIGSSLNYLYELAPDHLKASAQAFYGSVSSVAGILGNLIGGVIFDQITAKPFYMMVGCLYLLSVIVFFLSSRKKPSKTETE